MASVRPAAVAGSFYPAEAGELARLIEECFVSHPLGPRGACAAAPALVGGLAPHAGYVYSGPCAAHLYARLDPDTRRVIILGVNHRGRGARAALSPAEFWETPLGRARVDREMGERLREQVDFLTEDDRSHREEHSIEVELPFLQSVLGDFTFLPISLSHISQDECRRLGKALAGLCGAGGAAGEKIILLASSDLSHYLPPEENDRLDRLALEKVLALDAPGLLATVAENNIGMCGAIPAAVLLFAAHALGAGKAALLKHCHSGDAATMREVVGYASVAVEF